ncbi:MAG: phosphomannomutase/phosphoglucomutase [Gammaproteobacteria bacterium]|nr:phosphomannomutase/phosphoglucomutase [Gammaproteobacteria bacterium]
MIYQRREISPTVFRAYDIRGVIGEQLDEHAFYMIGQAIACQLETLGRADICLARDARLSSPVLSHALKQGLLDSGINVFDLGEVPTPVMYYATKTSGIDSGLMVTGSHNPADYNGIKMVLAGKTLVEEDIKALHERVLSGRVKSGSGQDKLLTIVPDYITRIVSDMVVEHPLRVVVDCGNGVAGAMIPNILRQLGCEVIELYCEVDGSFPNHHPDPTVLENLEDLRVEVALHQADVGLAFDGDADRLGVVTNTGEVIWPDRLMMLYAQQVLKAVPGATVVFDVKCSSHLANVIRAAGGVPRMCPTGHSIVKSVMKETHAALAGEMSGHIFFENRWYGFDDALYSACRLLEIMSASKQKLSALFETIPNSVNTPEIKIPIFDEKKFEFIKQFIKEASFPDADLITIDGLRAEFSNGWGLIRASNTTPCLVARFEAESDVGLDKIKALFKVELQALDESLEIPF